MPKRIHQNCQHKPFWWDIHFGYRIWRLLIPQCLPLLVPKNLEKKHLMKKTWLMEEILHQLRLVVCPITLGGVGWLLRISSIVSAWKSSFWGTFFDSLKPKKYIGIRMPKRSRGLRSMLSLASPEKETQDQTSCTRNSEFSNFMQFKS